MISHVVSSVSSLPFEWGRNLMQRKYVTRYYDEFSEGVSFYSNRCRDGSVRPFPRGLMKSRIESTQQLLDSKSWKFFLASRRCVRITCAGLQTFHCFGKFLMLAFPWRATDAPSTCPYYHIIRSTAYEEYSTVDTEPTFISEGGSVVPFATGTLYLSKMSIRQRHFLSIFHSTFP